MPINRQKINNRREEAIFSFCNQLHDDIDELYELMMDGSDSDEKAHVESILFKFKDLNSDR